MTFCGQNYRTYEEDDEVSDNMDHMMHKPILAPRRAVKIDN